MLSQLLLIRETPMSKNMTYIPDESITEEKTLGFRRKRRFQWAILLNYSNTSQK